jgi:hypothetical protein
MNCDVAMLSPIEYRTLDALRTEMSAEAGDDSQALFTNNLKLVADSRTMAM